MGNCLVTKLKSTIDNNALVTLGCFRVKVYDKDFGNNGNVLSVSGTKPFTVTVVGGAKMIATSASDLTNDPKASVEIPGTGSLYQVYLKRGNYEIEISEKYTITKASQVSPGLVTLFGYSIDDWKFSPINTAIMQGNNISGDISVLKNVEKLFIFACNVTGDIACFNNKTIKGASGTFSNITIARCSVFGDISNLAKMDNAVEILDINTSDISGTLESLIAGMSRTTGTLAVTCNGKVTLGGTAVANNTVKTYNFQTSEWS